MSIKTLSPQQKDQLQNQHWVLIPDLLPEPVLISLKRQAQEWWDQGRFQPAQVGRRSDRQRQEDIRSDWIAWLDLRQDSFADLSSLITSLQQELNRDFFLGIRDFEVHFARYSEGQHYDEHIDQSPKKDLVSGERVISFVLYLNENWQTGDGGELQVRQGQDLIRIEPRWGHLMLFRSDTLPHRVLTARKERWSLTGWFRRS
jgi:SM-20-related protein